MDNETLDHDVREAIEPDAATVDRLIREALRQRPRRPVRGPVVATAGAVLLLVTALLVLNRGIPRIVHAHVRVTNVGETIVVKPSPGGVWLIGAERASADHLPAGTIIVYRSGGGR